MHDQPARSEPGRHSLWGRPEAELDLLLRCCAATPDPARIREAAARVDWPRLIAAGHRHRVLGLLAAALKHAAVAPPPALAAELRSESAAITLQNLRYAAETARLAGRLRDAGMPALFFKGSTLAMQAYGSLAHKQAKDIDFLVLPRDLERCIALLEADGYRADLPVADLPPRRWPTMLRYLNEIALTNAAGIQLEPHWRLTLNPRLLRLPLDRGIFETIAGVPVPTLGRDDLFAYLCAHGAVSGWFRLKWLADLEALLADADDDEVERLWRHAAAHGAGPAASLGLGLCAALFDRALPPVIAAEIARHRALRFLHRHALRNLLGPELVSRRQLALTRLANAYVHGALGTELWQVVLGSDAWCTPLPAGLHWLHPITRLPGMLRRRFGEALSGTGQRAGEA